jgi:hypothetical protein
MVCLILSDVFEDGLELEAEVSSLLPLNAHDFLNTLSDIEHFKILPELVRLDLGIVEHILNDEAHHVGRGLLDLDAHLELLHYL